VLLRGNGILAVYLTGLGLGQAEFPNKNYITKFNDGLSWICQIVMFVTLGLLVFPSHLVPLAGPGLLITFLLMVVARPVSVFLCLQPFKMNIREKTLISWVGLRGSVPIILATFPFTANIAHAEIYFNIVFFVVIASVFIQGTSIPFVSKILKLDAPYVEKKNYPLEFVKTEEIDADLVDVFVPNNSEVAGRKIGELDFCQQCLVVLISRDNRFIVPSPATIIEGGDTLLVLSTDKDIRLLQDVLVKIKTPTQTKET